MSKPYPSLITSCNSANLNGGFGPHESHLMIITATKLTDETLLRAACDATRHPGQNPSTATLRAMYQCEHSPVRTQLFWIRMKGIPTFVSVHLVRHSATGQSHFVESNRDDRGGTDTTDRLTPVNHSMLLNAQHLIDMAKKRLCYASHKTTVGVFVRLRNAIHKVDPALAEVMVPECVVRGYCPELRPCRLGPEKVIRSYPDSHHNKKRAGLV